MTSVFFFRAKSHRNAGGPLIQWVYHHQVHERVSSSGKRPHDLDRPRVFREHHLAFGAVDVVANVDLLRSPQEPASLPSNRWRDSDSDSSRCTSFPWSSPPQDPSSSPSKALDACSSPHLAEDRIEELQLQDVVRRRMGNQLRIEECHRARGLDHPAHQVKLVADHGARNPVTRHRHRGQRQPGIGCRVIRLDAPERADELPRSSPRRLRNRFCGRRSPSPRRFEPSASAPGDHSTCRRAGSYASTTLVFVAVMMKAWPVRPPMT